MLKLLNLKPQDEATSPSPIVLLPGVIFLGIFFVVPLILIFRYSLYYDVIGSLKIRGALTLDNYINFFKDKYFVKIFILSLKIAVEVSVFDIILAYPVAYFLARSKSKIASFVSGLSYLPLLASSVVTSFGWMIILSDEGFLNHILLSFNIVSNPLKIMYTERGVLIALVQASLPFMVVSIRNVIFTIDRYFEDASATLGAKPFQTFFHVTLPLSFPGVAAGTLLVFVTAMSAFVTPALIGGGRVDTLASVILRETQMNLNWSLASTISIIILVVTCIVLFVYNQLLESKWLGGGGRR
ncbi:MAG: hypothetical protein ACFWT7_00220 [Succiniclasticum sp.]